MHGIKTKQVNTLLIIIAVLAIFVLASLFVLLLKWILPAPVLTTQFFASVDELSTLAEQNGSLDKFNDEFTKEIDHLERASNELVQTTPTGQLKTISDDIFSVSQWLKTNRLILVNAAKHQQKYKAIVDSLTKDASNLEMILQKMPTANGDWIASLLLGILWVGVFIGVLVYLFHSPGVLRILSTFLGLLRSFKGFGLELNFAEKNRSNDEIHIAFQKVFSELRQQVRTHLKLFSQRKNLQKMLAETSEEVIAEINRLRNDGRKNIDFRCTVHVPDMLLDQFLCQLLDYEPKGKGMGRAWSIFYGMIGRTWRSCQPELLHLGPSQDASENMLRCIREYGMTKDQVKYVAKGRKSYMAIPLKDAMGDMLGVFYIDADELHAFGTNKNDKAEEIQNEIICATSKSVGKLAELLKDYRKQYMGKAPLIQILGA